MVGAANPHRAFGNQHGIGMHGNFQGPFSFQFLALHTDKNTVVFEPRFTVAAVTERFVSGLPTTAQRNVIRFFQKIIIRIVNFNRTRAEQGTIRKHGYPVFLTQALLLLTD